MSGWQSLKIEVWRLRLNRVTANAGLTEQLVVNSKATRQLASPSTGYRDLGCFGP